MNSPTLFSCSDLARLLRRNRVAVWRAIERLAIPPAATVSNGRVKLYGSETLLRLQNSLRKANTAK